MHKKLLLVATLLVGCQTLAPAFPAEDVMHSGAVHTLAFDAGKATPEMYAPSYVVTADRVCGEGQYDVLEKSNEPTTIRDVPGLKGLNRYFWVVKCRQAAAH